MANETQERLSLGTVESQGRKDENEWQRQDNKHDSSAHKSVDHEERHQKPNHPQQLPPSERTSDFVLNIDKLWDTKHHTIGLLSRIFIESLLLRNEGERTAYTFSPISPTSLHLLVAERWYANARGELSKGWEADYSAG